MFSYSNSWILQKTTHGKVGVQRGGKRGSGKQESGGNRKVAVALDSSDDSQQMTSHHHRDSLSSLAAPSGRQPQV